VHASDVWVLRCSCFLLTMVERGCVGLKRWRLGFQRAACVLIRYFTRISGSGSFDLVYIIDSATTITKHNECGFRGNLLRVCGMLVGGHSSEFQKTIHQCSQVTVGWIRRETIDAVRKWIFDEVNLAAV